MLSFPMQLFICTVSLGKGILLQTDVVLGFTKQQIILLWFCKICLKIFSSKEISIKTHKYTLSLGSSFQNKPEMDNQKKLSLGNDRKIAFIPRSDVLKSFSG